MATRRTARGTRTEAKAPDAFRTISEVAAWLEVSPHVLRFWESKFPQVKPVKRAGGRRYYRAGDMALLGGIKQLLHEDGLTIKGAQKLLREKGVRHVSALSRPLPAEEPAEAPPAPADTAQPGLFDGAAPTQDARAPDGDTPAGTAAPSVADAPAEAEEPVETGEGDPAEAPTIADLPDATVEASGDEARDAATPEQEAEEPTVVDVPDIAADAAGEGNTAAAASETEAPIPAEFQETVGEATGPADDPAASEPDAADAGAPAADDAGVARPGARAAPGDPGTAEGPVIAPLPDLPEPAEAANAAHTGPQIAPLPGDEDLSLTDRLSRLPRGAIPAERLAPLLDRAHALRARMETRRSA